jgi:hypothetical protein
MSQESVLYTRYFQCYFLLDLNLEIGVTVRELTGVDIMYLTWNWCVEVHKGCVWLFCVCARVVLGSDGWTACLVHGLFAALSFSDDTQRVPRGEVSHALDSEFVREEDERPRVRSEEYD